MSVIRVGSSSSYADGWSLAFAKAAKPAAGRKAKAAKKVAKPVKTAKPAKKKAKTSAKRR